MLVPDRAPRAAEPPRIAAPERPARPPAAPIGPPPAPTPPAPPALSTEEWVGQRGILAAAVILIILAVGFFLKVAFDRGWISPAMRCIGGVVLGATGAAIGWRLHPRYRQYGAAVIGLGFGIIYLAIWAAAGIYQLVPQGQDLTALTLVSFALAVVAFILDEEALAAAAAVGAFLAPVVMGSRGNPNTLLLYLAIVGSTLGAANVVKRWRLATLLVAAAFFGLGLVAAGSGAVPWRVCLFAAMGAAGIMVGLRERWTETRVLSFFGGWGLLAMSVRVYASPLVPVVGVLLTAPMWWHAMRTSRIWPDPRVTGESEAAWSVGESVPFYVTPILLGWAISTIAPRWFNAHLAAAPFIVGLAYLAAGYQKPRYPFALAGAAAMAFATMLQWPRHEGVFVLLGLSLVWAGLDHWLARIDGRWYAVGTLGLAIWSLARTLVDRGSGPAFVDGWAGALWFCIIVPGVLASGLWMRLPGESRTAASERKGKPPRTFTDSWVSARNHWAPMMPSILWSTSGGLLLIGVTAELNRYFGQRGWALFEVQLWSGLAISAWWAVYAGGLVLLGFRRNIKQARIAGLGVAGLAIAKVLLVDLSSLDALYRVGSIFILGTVSLLVAYLYHRRARTTGQT